MAGDGENEDLGEHFDGKAANRGGRKLAAFELS